MSAQGSHMAPLFLRTASHDELVAVLRELPDDRLALIALSLHEMFLQRITAEISSQLNTLLSPEVRAKIEALRAVKAGNAAFPSVSTESGFAQAHASANGGK